MGILAWLIIGGVAGYVAGRQLSADGTAGGGVVPGILGAALGGFLVDLMLRGDSVMNFNAVTLIGAVVGAVLLAAAWVLTNRRTAHHRPG